MGSVFIRAAAYLISGVFFGLALWLALWSYVPQSQINTPVLVVISGMTGGVAGAWLLKKASQGVILDDLIVSPSQTLASDLVCVIAAALSWFFILDGYSARYFGQISCGTDPLAADVIAFMILPAALVLALVVTQTGNQQIRIEKDGVRLRGASSSAFIPWGDIASFKTETQYVLVGRVGVLIPRHLRTNLVIVRRDGSVERIFDPGSGTARGSLVARLSKTMPEQLKESFSAVAMNWA